MNSDEAADAMVSHYLQYFYGSDAEEDPIIAFQPQNPAQVPEVLVERDDYVVFCFADSETETAIDRDDACEERLVVAVVVAGPINDITTRALAIKFAKQIRRALRNTTFEDEDGNSYVWIGNETDLYDVEAMKTKSQFVSVFRATYYGVN